MGHEQIMVKKGRGAFKRSRFGFTATPMNTNTVQSPVQHYRDLGNQAVQRMIESGTIQAKLTIGQPNDKYEQEADRVADQVMRMPDSVIQRQSTCPECVEEEEGAIQTKPLAEQITPLVQRQMAPEEEEKEEEELIQTKGEGGTNPQVTSSMESRIQSLKSGGHPLPESTSSFFEPRFGVDFSQVRVHNNPKAAYVAQAVNARAFTAGKDVVFGAGQYSPGTNAGKRLLAHELTHVVQQRNGLVSSTPQIVQCLTNPLSDMTTFQSPGASGWRGAIWGCYRSNCTKKHKGWDIHASEGTECKAVVAGTTSHASEGNAGYGDYVILTSSSDPTKKYYYAHLRARESASPTVPEGDKVGETGVTGNANSDRPHLHFTVKESGSKVDPDGKGFTKPTKVIETGTTSTTIDYSEADPCTPCSM